MENNEQTPRPIGRALVNGLLQRCPSCEQGKLFSGYLSVNDNCPSCAIALNHHRADDGPAWATMLIVLHMLPPIVLAAYEFFPDTSPWILAAFASVFFVLVTLFLLPRAKGAFITVQWANRMFGFGGANKPADDVQDPTYVAPK